MGRSTLKWGWRSPEWLSCDELPNLRLVYALLHQRGWAPHCDDFVKGDRRISGMAIDARTWRGWDVRSIVECLEHEASGPPRSGLVFVPVAGLVYRGYFVDIVGRFVFLRDEDGSTHALETDACLEANEPVPVYRSWQAARQYAEWRDRRVTMEGITR